MVGHLLLALVNIVKNAIEAIDNAGTVIVSIDIKRHRLIVTDNGKAISEKDSARLLSPFFSTKNDGQGIGLTLVREILLNHGYEFSLQTTGIDKTVFTIHFH